MKSHRLLLVSLLLSTGTSSANANSCLQATDLVRRAVTERLMSICRTEFGRNLSYNKVYATAQKNFGNLSVPCYNRCRTGETPERCAQRFSASETEQFINAARPEMSRICANAELR